jgi:hypothetical protein
MLDALGGLFVSALVLSACVPLYLSAQRGAERGVARVRMQEMAREIEGHLREDIRQAERVEAGSPVLRLSLRRASQPSIRDRVTYRWGAGGLTREVVPGGAGREPERALYGSPLAEVRFSREGTAVHSRLEFRERTRGLHVTQLLDCTATPRSAQ